MKTTKPISTISYNSLNFLKYKLDCLLEDGVINFYMGIVHQPEEDEKKEHIHLYILPHSQVDTMKLESQFIELVHGEKKPRKTIFFVKSDPDNWILYNQHFAPYLLSKMESRVYHYQKEDFFYSDEASFDYYYHHAFGASDWAKDNQILANLRDPNYSAADLILSGQVSWYHSTQIQAISNLIERYGSTYRGYHKGHDEA